MLRNQNPGAILQGTAFKDATLWNTAKHSVENCPLTQQSRFWVSTQDN